MRLLSGVTVLDLSRLLPGPLSTWHLQLLGAEVIKIEHPHDGDYARAIGPLDGTESFLYRHLNANKALRLLNLGQDEDRRQFLELVQQSDAVIESFRPGVMKRLGVSFQDLRAVNPRISLVSISGYGQAGAMALASGHDINYMAVSGWLYELVKQSRTPHMPNVQTGDVFAGVLNAALAVVSAVLAARHSGVGHHLDVSITAGLLVSNVVPMLAVQSGSPAQAPETSLLDGGAPCYRVYATADNRHLAIGALELKFWRKFCQAIGRIDWADRHWQNGQAPGGEDARALIEELSTVLVSRPLAYWTSLLEHVDCCVTPVLRMDEAMEHAVNAPYVTAVETPTRRAMKTVVSPVRVVA